jgi:hypothetical protein
MTDSHPKQRLSGLVRLVSWHWLLAGRVARWHPPSCPSCLTSAGGARQRVIRLGSPHLIRGGAGSVRVLHTGVANPCSPNGSTLGRMGYRVAGKIDRTRRVSLEGIHSFPEPVNLVCRPVPSRRRTYYGDDEESGDVGAASRSSADRFGSMAELPLFRRPTVMRRSNSRPPGGDRRR